MNRHQAVFLFEHPTLQEGFRGKEEFPPEQFDLRSGEGEQRAFERTENASVEGKLPKVSP
jgi:hypothetical protein